jgi:ribonuclease D
VRGLERGDLKRLLPVIGQHIEQALKLPEDQWPEKPRHAPMPQLSVLGQFLFSALGSICRQLHLAPGLAGNPTDVRELIAYRTSGRRRKPPRLACGWRAEVIGKTFEDLLAGRLSIRIDDPLSEHPLVIEPTGR